MEGLIGELLRGIDIITHHMNEDMWIEVAQRRISGRKASFRIREEALECMASCPSSAGRRPLWIMRGRWRTLLLGDSYVQAHLRGRRRCRHHAWYE